MIVVTAISKKFYVHGGIEIFLMVAMYLNSFWNSIIYGSTNKHFKTSFINCFLKRKNRVLPLIIE